MRIAVDATPLVGPRTGVGRFVEALMPALEARGDVELAPYVLSRRAHEIPEGVRRILMPARVAVKVWGRGGPSLTSLLPRADVIHGTNQIAPPGSHTVITVHDCSFVTAREMCTPTVAAFGPVVRRVAAAGGWIHTPSEHVAVEARALFETDRVVAVPHGAPDLPAIDTSAGARSIVAVGTLEPRKNLVRLVHAFASIATHDREVTLVLAGGEGRDADRVRAAVSALEPAVRARVTITGWLSEVERTRVIASARLLAYPSLDEGFGLPMVEAWQLGVPVVAARAGALPEVAGDAAMLVDPLDVDALAGALEQMLDDDAARASVLAKGRTRVTRFSWKAAAEGIVAIYGRAMQDRPR